MNNQIAQFRGFLFYTFTFGMLGDLFGGLKVRLSSIKKNWTRERSILLIVFISATVIRSIPGWMNAAWGNDFGIYYGITKDFAENPELFRPYSGWGSSYNYFPVLYVIVAFFHWLTGLSIVWLMPRITPIFGGLAVLLFYFVVREIVTDKRLALLSTAFLAANPFHIYQTSHAAPLTIGHFFMILCIYLFVRRKKTSVSTVALFLCSMILVASHHLTSFFYLTTIVFITFYKNFISKEWSKDLKREIFYILFISAFTFLYWMFIAVPVYRGSIRTGLLIPSWSVILIFYVVLIILFTLIMIRRRFDLSSKAQRRLRLSIWQSILISLVACSVFVVIFSFTTIPTTGFIFEKTAIIFLIPLIIAVGFAVYGRVVLEGKRKRAYVLGWFYPISISFVFATITWHEALYPFRHLEYIAYPLSILCGIGVYTYWRTLRKEEAKGNPTSKPKKWPPSRFFEYFVVIVLILNLVSAYAVQRTTSRYEESISEEVFDAVYWMQGNVSGTNFTVASDHRISQILWAEGYNATSDAAYVIWFCENWTECLDELQTANGTMPQIRYVLIDDVMRFQGVQSNINETPQPMTTVSYDKFQSPPFSLLYRSESEDGEHWAELYEVDWEYIEENRR